MESGFFSQIAERATSMSLKPADWYDLAKLQQYLVDSGKFDGHQLPPMPEFNIQQRDDGEAITYRGFTLTISLDGQLNQLIFERNMDSASAV